MNEARQNNGPLAVGFIIAILLHLLVAVPALHASWGVGGTSPLNSSLDGSSAAERKLKERLADALKKELERAEQEKENEVVPGMEHGADQGMTWIGYEEYQEHLAAHGEIDQAAFTENDAGGGGAPQAAAQPENPAAQQPPPDQRQQPRQPPQEQVAAQPTPPTTEAAAQPTPEVNAVAAASPQPATEPADTKGVNPLETPEVIPPTAPDGDDQALPPAVQKIDAVPTPSAQLPPTAPQNPTVMPEPVPRTQAQAPVAPAQPQPPATSPTVAPVAGLPGSTGPGQAQGERSDRESDATSIIDVPPQLWKTGKPLARKGLEIRTRKPALPLLTQLTTRPANPICEILFGKDGVPVSCKILRSSGEPDVDGPVLDALYRWRAKGSQLDKLAPGKTVTFRVRFILN